MRSNLTIADLQEQLDRIRSQILYCVAEAKTYVKHVERLNEKVKTLAIEEERLSIVMEKIKNNRPCN
jgi:hypothetical protein